MVLHGLDGRAQIAACDPDLKLAPIILVVLVNGTLEECGVLSTTLGAMADL